MNDQNSYKGLVVVSVILVSWTLPAQQLVRYPVSTANSFTSPYLFPTETAANITASAVATTGLTALDFLTVYDGHFIFKNWQTGPAPVPNDKYYSFIITPNPGFQINFSAIKYTLASQTPNATWQLRSSVDNFTSNFGVHVTQPGLDANQYEFTDNISSLGPQTGPVTFRLYGYNEVATNYSGLVNTPANLAGDPGTDVFLVAATVNDLNPPSSSTTSTTFITKDTATQGNWRGVYGADGYNIINQAANYPSYVAATPIGITNYIWASSTSDVRALYKRGVTTDRFAGCWYSGGSFIVDLNLTDGLIHRVALYVLDWDTTARAETVEILDAISNSVLSSQSVTGFNGGQYLVWDLKGHVNIRLTRTGSFNAVLSALFFDTPGAQPPPPPPAQATFVTKDTTTQGSWKGVYGADGYSVINHAMNYPGYATAAPSGKINYVWASSTSDGRALQKMASTTERVAACWYSASSFVVDLNLTDGLSHRVALYCLDWDTTARAQTIEILDASNNGVLSSQNVTGFNGGQYLVWDIKGHVLVRLIKTGSFNAILSGIFFDTPGSPPPNRTLTVASSNPNLGVSVAVSPNDNNAQGSGSTSFTRTYNNNGEVMLSAPSAAGGNLFQKWQRDGSDWSTTPSTIVTIDGNHSMMAVYVAPPPPSAQVTFVTKDTSTKGNWKGVYGADGYNIINDTVNYPSYGIATPGSKLDYTWASSTSDVRALQKPASTTSRVAACWYSTQKYQTVPERCGMDLNFSDGLPHRVALYCVDWDTTARAQTIEIVDSFNNTVFSSQNVTAFNGGQYLVWDIQGHVEIRINKTGSYNAVLSGIFFDPVPGVSPQNISHFAASSSELASMHSARFNNGAFEINLEGDDQEIYIVEASTDLIHWLPLLNALVGRQLSDREAGKFEQRFYRVVRTIGIPPQTSEIETK